MLYHCDVCRKVCSQASNLTAHLQMPSGEKPFSCAVWQKLFSWRSFMTAHLRTQSGIKAYLCNICNLEKTNYYLTYYKQSDRTSLLLKNTVEKPSSTHATNRPRYNVLISDPLTLSAIPILHTTACIKSISIISLYVLRADVSSCTVYNVFLNIVLWYFPFLCVFSFNYMFGWGWLDFLLLYQLYTSVTCTMLPRFDQ